MSDPSEHNSDSYLTEKIFNVLKSNPDYEKKVEETFEYFRMGSPEERYEIDVKDLSDDIISDIDSCIKNCETVEEKYGLLNESIVKAIKLMFEKYKPKILETKKHNRKESKQAFTRLSPSISNQWMLSNINQISLPNSLSELIGYVPQYSGISSKDEVKNIDYKDHKLLQKDSKKKRLENKETEKEEPQNQKEIENLLSTVKGVCIETFKDQINRFYATVRIKDHIECIELQGDRFRNIIRTAYYITYRKLLSDERLGWVINLIEAEMMFNEDIKKIDLKLRVAKKGDTVFYYDLTNPMWEVRDNLRLLGHFKKS